MYLAFICREQKLKDDAFSRDKYVHKQAHFQVSLLLFSKRQTSYLSQPSAEVGKIYMKVALEGI